MPRTSFTGEHTQRIDGKGRMSIPADFRRVLERNDPEWTDGLPSRLRLMYGAHLRNKLEVTSVAAFDAITARIEAAPPSKETKALSYMLLTQSCEIELDRDGRIVLPARHRAKLGLAEGEVVFAGVGERFEIWPADAYAGVEADIQAYLDAQDEDFDPMAALHALGG